MGTYFFSNLTDVKHIFYKCKQKQGLKHPKLKGDKTMRDLFLNIYNIYVIVAIMAVPVLILSILGTVYMASLVIEKIAREEAERVFGLFKGVEDLHVYLLSLDDETHKTTMAAREYRHGWHLKDALRSSLRATYLQEVRADLLEIYETIV